MKKIFQVKHWWYADTIWEVKLTDSQEVGFSETLEGAISLVRKYYEKLLKKQISHEYLKLLAEQRRFDFIDHEEQHIVIIERELEKLVY